MRRQSLNKKSLYQTGGQTQKVDPAIIDIVNSIKSALQSGEAPESLAIELIQQNIPQDQISSAFEQVGYDPAAIVDLMQNAMTQLQQQQIANQPQVQPQGQQEEQFQEQPQEQPQEQSQMAYGGYINNYQFGGTQNYINDQLNPEVRRPLYMPLQQPQGDVFGATLTAADAFDSMFNKDTGSFRNFNKKRDDWKNSKEDYYKYDVKINPNDPNTYQTDYNDIKQGKLRTVDQYKQDTNKNSRIKYNPATGKYETMISSNPIDPNKVDPAQKQHALNLQKYGVDLNDFKNMPKETSVGVNPQGQQSYYMNTDYNPYYYDNAVPGLSNLDTREIKKTRPDFISMPFTPGVSYKSQYAHKYGGGLKMFVDGGTPLSYDQWLNENSRGTMGSEMQDQNDYQTYLNNFEQSNLASDPTVAKPQITKSMNAVGKFKHFMNSPGMNAYKDASKAGVALAGVINQGFQQSKYNDYENKLRDFTMADNIFGTSTNPVNKRGTWDINTGLAEPNNYVTGSYAEGGEIHDVDMKTLTQLIAAGADIKIL